jgi:transcriptional antiterminator RfaH
MISGNDGSIDDSNGAPGAPRWYVIYTKPHSENRVWNELQKKGISVFLPKTKEVRFRKHGLEEHIVPLFPNYLFARFVIPEDYYRVKWARGLKRIVGSGDTPIPLDDSIVAFLRQQADQNGLIIAKPGLIVGDKVRVDQGPLKGLRGVVHGQMDSKGRVRVLMDILHSQAKVELPHSHLRKYA